MEDTAIVLLLLKNNVLSVKISWPQDFVDTPVHSLSANFTFAQIMEQGDQNYNTFHVQQSENTANQRIVTSGNSKIFLLFNNNHLS